MKQCLTFLSTDKMSCAEVNTCKHTLIIYRVTMLNFN